MRHAFRYRPEILEALAERGIVPQSGTSPERLRELVNDLYVFEIRDLKLRHQEMERVLGPQPLTAYRQGVLALKAKYQPLLGHPAEAWVVPEER